jgi:hypothetical protein
MDYWQLLKSPGFWATVIPLAFLLLLFTVALIERRHTRPFVPARRAGGKPPGGARKPTLDYSDDTPDPSQISPYVAVMARDLAAAGFESGGLIAQVRKRIRILGAVYWSPQRDILVAIGSGTVLNMPAYQTRLLTRLRDGRLLVTTDNNDEGDPSGIYRFKRVLNAEMHRLLEVHRERMARQAKEIVPFSEPTAQDALAGVYQRRASKMVERGIATWIDAGGTMWRYTPLGALLVCRDFFRQLGGGLMQFWRVKSQPVADTNLMPMGTALVAVEADESSASFRSGEV